MIMEFQLRSLDPIDYFFFPIYFLSPQTLHPPANANSLWPTSPGPKMFPAALVLERALKIQLGGSLFGSACSAGVCRSGE